MLESDANFFSSLLMRHELDVALHQLRASFRCMIKAGVKRLITYSRLSSLLLSFLLSFLYLFSRRKRNHEFGSISRKYFDVSNISSVLKP